MRLLLLIAAALLSTDLRASDRPPQVVINPPYVVTPTQVVDAMVRLAGIRRDDVVYDLGCGDGRIAIEAVKAGAARGVGIDLSAERIQEAKANAERAGAFGRLEFRRADVLDTPLRDATVVMMYLMPELNLRLRGRLRSELRPGSRVVSHAFDMGDWKPDQVVQTNGTRLYYWVIR